MMLQVFLLCVWTSSFSHSSRVGLLAANFLSFLSPEVLISTLFLKGSFRISLEFWVDSYLLSGLESVVLLPFGLHNFWWKVDWKKKVDWIIVLITLKILSLDLCYFSFGQLLQLLGLCLSDLEKFQSLFVQIFFSVPFAFSSPFWDSIINVRFFVNGPTGPWHYSCFTFLFF